MYYWFGSNDQYRGAWAMGRKHGKVRRFAVVRRGVGGSPGFMLGFDHPCVARVCLTHQGTYIWASGNTYVGQWEHDQVHGQGCFTSRVHGHKYTGSWVQNRKEGRGRMEYSDGNTYALCQCAGRWWTGLGPRLAAQSEV